MRFGVFYELQLPKPWAPGNEHRLFKEALDQVVLADRLGYDHAWKVEHHFRDEYSHSSAPEVFLASAAALTKHIRLGHGIRQVIARYNHPPRAAECIATLDLLSDGRVDFGIGEGATRLELGRFGIPVKKKRAVALEAAEQIAGEGAGQAPGIGTPEELRRHVRGYQRLSGGRDQTGRNRHEHICAALARKPHLRPLADDEIPVVKASVAQAQIGCSLT